MDKASRELIQKFVAAENGDLEKAAKWMARNLKIAGIARGASSPFLAGLPCK